MYYYQTGLGAHEGGTQYGCGWWGHSWGTRNGWRLNLLGRGWLGNAHTARVKMDPERGSEDEGRNRWGVGDSMQGSSMDLKRKYGAAQTESQCVRAGPRSRRQAGSEGQGGSKTPKEGCHEGPGPMGWSSCSRPELVGSPRRTHPMQDALCPHALGLAKE